MANGEALGNQMRRVIDAGATEFLWSLREE